jgi:hypothetical protein
MVSKRNTSRNARIRVQPPTAIELAILAVSLAHLLVATFHALK